MSTDTPTGVSELAKELREWSDRSWDKESCPFLYEFADKVEALERDNGRSMRLENIRLINQLAAKDAEMDRRRSLLENVINELDLSEAAIEEHGPLGTEPAELVRLVLDEKDRRLRYKDKRIAELEARLQQ